MSPSGSDVKDMVKLFGESAILEPLPYDMQLVTRNGLLPMERKKVPSDFLASVSDGRLSQQIMDMRAVSPFYVVLLHGEFVYKSDGTLVTGNKHDKSRWTRKAIRNLKRTIQYVEGAFIEEASTDQELVEVVTTLQEYFDSNHHFSMRTRPSMESDWFVPRWDERILHFYQGIPGVSIVRSRSLFKVCPKPLDLYQMTLDDFQRIDGFGPKLSRGVYNFLRTGGTNDRP